MMRRLSWIVQRHIKRVLIKVRKESERRKPTNNRSRDQRDMATSQGIVVPSESERDKELTVPWSLQKELAQLIL